MVTLESSISIGRPADEVFAYVSDLRNDPKWHTDMIEVRPKGEGPVTVGSEYDLRIKPFMGVSEGKLVVEEYAPGRRIVLRGQMGKFKPLVTYAVEPEGQGSRFTRRVEMQPPGIMRLMAPLMGGMMRKQNAGFVANLKRVLEGPA